MTETRDLDSVLVREQEAQALVRTIANPITRNLVQLCLTAILMRVLRDEDRSEAEWHAALPQTPVDVRFLAEALGDAFKNVELLKAVVEGKSLAEATGWDVD